MNIIEENGGTRIMTKPKKLTKGDKIAIVSLSRGILGMPFCKHELDIAMERLKKLVWFQ